MKKELEQFETQISQLYALKRQRDQILKRIEYLNQVVKGKVIAYAGHPNSHDNYVDMPKSEFSTTANLNAIVEYVPTGLADQAEIDQAFAELDIFEKYAESHVPSHAVEEARLNDELPAHVDFVLQNQPRLRLRIERKSDVSSQDECDS